MEDDLFASGHRACAGCGSALALRHLTKAAGKNSVFTIATGCMEVVSTQYPTTAWGVPLIHTTFENAASVAAGIKEALNQQGKEDTNVIALAGDGGMVDIGFRALSGSLERGHDVLYVCYDNGAYMNTGVQKSGATPFGASTTTTPAGKQSHGKSEWQKNVPFIALMHGVNYVATASIADLDDFKKKVKKALEVEGPKYIHVHCPCPIGWGFDTSETIDQGRKAVESGAWVLYEIEDGNFSISYKPSERIPVKDYLSGQKRFKHLDEDDVETIQDHVDRNWEELKKLEGLDLDLLKLL